MTDIQISQMKKISSYPKITTKTNITVTQTQNININSPKAFGAPAFASTKKVLKIQKSSTQKGQHSQLKQPFSKPKSKTRQKLQSNQRRQSSGNIGNINHPPNMTLSHQERPMTRPDSHEEIKKIEEKLKVLQKKIDTMKDKKIKKELSSKRSQSKIKQSLMIPNELKSVLGLFKKKEGSAAKMLKKTQSDKYLLRPHLKKEKKDESALNTTNKKDDSDLIHQFVTQVTRDESTKIPKMQKMQRSEKISCYYIQNAVQSMKKNYLLPFKEHLNQSIQTMKYLQNNRKPGHKELQKHSINLPPSKFKYTLILDLDETLIHCNENLTIPHDVTLKIKFPTGEKIDAGVNIRPYARQLLHELSDLCEIIVFTASHECYANVVLDHLDPTKKLVSHRLFRPHCWQTEEGVYIKDLRVVKNRSIQNILLVDNAAYSYYYQMENGIPIIPYYDDKDDQELLHLSHYIRDIISIKQKGKASLQEINNNYFQLAAYSGYQDLETLTNTLYKNVIINHKQMLGI